MFFLLLNEFSLLSCVQSANQSGRDLYYVLFKTKLNGSNQTSLEVFRQFNQFSVSLINCILCLLSKSGVGSSKKERFLCALENIFKDFFLNKKKLGERLSSKDNTKILFLFFENINILN